VILPLDKRPVIMALAGSNGAGKTWQNKFGQQYGIQGIPTMWLVDRKGDVSDTNARDDLAGKVKRLLGEK
jgi:hypothetical protein